MTAGWIHKLAMLNNKADANRIAENVRLTAATALLAGYETVRNQ